MIITNINDVTDEERDLIQWCSGSTLFAVNTGVLTTTGEKLLKAIRVNKSTAPYPPKVQAVLDAAIAWQGIRCSLDIPHGLWTKITDQFEGAVTAYRATLAPPADLEKLKGEMDQAAECLLESAMNDGLHPGGGYDYGVKRRAYEAAVRQAEERGKAQEKAVKITEATEELNRTLSQLFSDSNTASTKDRLYASVYEAFKALQEAEGKS